MRLLIVHGELLTTIADGSVLAYVVVIVSPSTPGLGSKTVPSMLMVTVRKRGSVTRGKVWSDAPKSSWPETRLLLVPATSRRPKARCTLTGGWPASAILICVRMNSRSVLLKVTTASPLNGHSTEFSFWRHDEARPYGQQQRKDLGPRCRAPRDAGREKRDRRRLERCDASRSRRASRDRSAPAADRISSAPRTRPAARPEEAASRIPRDHALAGDPRS